MIGGWLFNRRRTATYEQLHDELHRLERRVVELENDHARLQHHVILTKLETIMATLDETLAKVTEEDTDIDSIIALLAGIKQQLADALSGANLPPAVQSKVDAIFSQATASADKIVAATQANVEEPAP